MVLSVRPNLGGCGGELGHASGSPAERQTPESQETPQPILRHLLGPPHLTGQKPHPTAATEAQETHVCLGQPS